MAVVSSRLGARGGLSTEWLEYFRDACQRIHAAAGVLVSGAGTTTGRFARQAAVLWNLPVLLLVAPPPRQSFDQWRAKLPSPSVAGHPQVFEVFVSPPTTELSGVDEPVEDGLLRDWSEQLFVISLRRRGHWERLLREDVATGKTLTRVHLAQSATLVSARLQTEFQAAGANEWLLAPKQAAGVEAGDIAESAPCLPVTEQGVSRSPEEDFLSHCTHRPIGPWPDEREEEFLAEVLRYPERVRRTACDALTRILRSGRLTASSAAIRGKFSVVCFSDLPLDELLQLREFQSQRHCWTFEPYGIQLRKSWLVDQGARPVVYGDDRVWRELPAADRPFFQRASSSRGKRSKDWTREREWRVLGEIDLHRAPAEAVQVFVATDEEAASLQAWCRWPVRVVTREAIPAGTSPASNGRSPDKPP